MGNNEFLLEMGKRIMRRRKTLRMTQEELAEKMGVSTQMISNLDLSADFVLTGVSTKNVVDEVAEKLSLLTTKELQIVSEIIDYMSNKK